MEALWYAIIAGMLGIYAVLDGFDFGVGVVHKLVAKSDEQRRSVLNAIGPVWDGNEVWLIASGAVFLMAFPRAYAAAFSGFYLALTIVLWLLVLRGAAIEFRSHERNPLWREFWDSVFVLASGMLALVLGTALGNVVRGVPVQEDGYFSQPLFTDFRTGPASGVFDWYTLLTGALTLIILAGHGALFLAWRTSGEVQDRSRRWAHRLWWTVLPTWTLATAATAWVRPEVFQNLFFRGWPLLLVAVMLGGGAGVFYFLRRDHPVRAFWSSSAFILGLIGSTLAGNYPYWLRSTISPEYSLTAVNTAAGRYGLTVAIVWFAVGISLAAVYFVNLYRSLGRDSGSDHY